MRRLLLALSLVVLALPVGAEVTSRPYALPSGGGSPHDVAVSADGGVWYTAQRDGKLGRLDPASGKVDLIPLGAGAARHGVIIGPDGAPWVTEGGTNAIVRVDPKTREVKRWPLPEERGYANLNTLTFDKRGRVWFTGQSGVYGRLDPQSGAMQVWDAPRGRGPYGIATTPDGAVYYASLAGSHIARVDLDTGGATVIEPPTKDQGARRVWSDGKGRIWVSEWNSGNVSRYDPAPIGSSSIARSDAVKLLFFDDFRLGVLTGDAVVDVSQVVRDIPHTGPHDLVSGLIERFADYKGRLEDAVGRGRGVPVGQVRI